MQVIKYTIFIAIFLTILNCQSYSQSVFSELELEQQTRLITELQYLRSSNKILNESKEVLESTVKIQTQIDELKSKQITMLLDIINNYEILKTRYEDQIKFQQVLIDNSNKIIESQQKLKKSGNVLDTIKSVLYAMLGVIIGRAIN